MRFFKVLLRICRLGIKWTLIGLGVTTSLVFIAIVGGVLYVNHEINDDDFPKPDLGPIIDFAPPEVGKIYDIRGVELYETAREYRHIVSYFRLSNNAKYAVMAAEDKRFWEHSGVDKIALVRAFAVNGLETLLASIPEIWNPRWRIKQGGSTIDRQLVSLMFRETLDTCEEKFTGFRARIERDLWCEIQIAVWMNDSLTRHYGSKRLAKQQIMMAYMNTVYFGHSYIRNEQGLGDQGRYGIGSAAQYFFGKDALELEIHEAALLAGMIKSPGAFAPQAGREDQGASLGRRNTVIDRMAKAEFISELQAEHYKRMPIEVPPLVRSRTIAPHAVSDVLYREDLGLRGIEFNKDQVELGEILTYVTIDSRIQEIVNEALDRGLDEYKERQPQNADSVQGAVVVLRNSDAAILAEAGSRSGSAIVGSLNRVHSMRQPGSAFKPFVYVAALQQGWDFKDLVYDGPNVCLPMGNGELPHCIDNFDGEFKGWIPLRQCLAESRNACTMWLTLQIGKEAVFSSAFSAGIQSPIAPYPTSALGASEVTLLELANAYRTLATGYFVRPYLIRRVLDRDTKELYVHRSFNSDDARILPDTLLIKVQEALRGTIRLPRATGTQLDNTRGFSPVSLMGKTGTSSEYIDALFIASSPGPYGITIACRVGIDNRTSRVSLGDKETGARVCLPIVKDILTRLHDEYVITQWPEFPEEVEKNIDVYLQR